MDDLYHLGVKVLIQNPKGKFLLLKVKSPNRAKPYWDLPGGRVKTGENPVGTLKREVEEECGLHIAEFTKIGNIITDIRIPKADGDVGLILAIYLCTAQNLEKIGKEGEFREFKWASAEEVVQAITLFSSEFASLMEQFP